MLNIVNLFLIIKHSIYFTTLQYSQVANRQIKQHKHVRVNSIMNTIKISNIYNAFMHLIRLKMINLSF